MPEGIDRSMQSNRLLLGVVIALAVIVASGVGLIWLWTRSTDASHKTPAMQDRQLAQPFPGEEPLPITLYCPEGGMLETRSVLVKGQFDMQSQAREALAALFMDKRASLAPVMRDIRLRAFYLDASGTAYIDLTAGLKKDVLASGWEEQLAIYAMVNTLLRNFDDIKQVLFLLEGGEAQTLAGHMDLSRTFTKRMDLVRQ